MLPDVMADAVERSGGLGLAENIWRQLKTGTPGA
jgi:Rod binding domain-containing protein